MTQHNFDIFKLKLANCHRLMFVKINCTVYFTVTPSFIPCKMLFYIMIHCQMALCQSVKIHQDTIVPSTVNNKQLSLLRRHFYTGSLNFINCI